MGKIMTSLTTGLIVGAAVGLMVAPNLDRKTQRAIKKVGKTVLDFAEDSVHWID